ncbi:MAG: flagellar export chaperone FlgN [Candidatus Lindowbacteria bacterium]|nr:flagellar export chaperone FlgN [Candidatus Lindowbacteria bacterium]
MDFQESAEQKIQQFYDKLRAQSELYQTLLGLAKRQTLEISYDNIDAFMLLMEEKKKVVEKIEQVEVAAAPLREYWETNRDGVSEQTRTKLRAVVDQIRGLLEELLEVEAQSQQKLGIAKNAVGEELRQVSVGSKAMRSYRRHPDGKPRFMDETG